jgi:hypothetical protein
VEHRAVSRAGHTVVALAVGGFIALAIPHSALLGVSVALTGSLPDALEGVVGFGPTGNRRSLIPHRTLTHSPWGWLVALAFGLMLPGAATPWGQLAIGKFLAGIAVGALVHLMIDIFSPTGIPLGNPFGPRISLGPYRTARGIQFLYRTSTPDEWPLLVPFVLMLAAEGTLIGTRISGVGIPKLSALALAVLTGA